MGGKWLDLLKKMLPHTTRVAVMFNPVEMGQLQKLPVSLDHFVSKRESAAGPTVANGVLRTWLDLQLAPPSRE
jgi:hypothetical protein